MESSKFTLEGKIVKYSLVDTKKSDEVISQPVIVTDVKLPSDSPARVKTLRAEGRKWYLTVVHHEQSEAPFALFCTTNSKEKSAQTSDAVELLMSLARGNGVLEEHVDALEEKITNDNNVNKLTRSISLLLRHRVPITDIVTALDNTSDMFVGSFLFQIKKFLSQYIKDGDTVEGGECDDCGGTHLVFSEGCMTCADCGSSKCG